MFRGIIFLLGLLILFIGVMDKVQFKAVATTPSEISATDAAALVKNEDDVFVRIKSSLEDRKIFPTSVTAPHYSACSQDTIVPISIKSDQSRILGCKVKIAAVLEPRQVEIVSVRKKKLQQDEEKGRYILAPIASTQLKLWVLSPFFQGSNASDAQGWASQSQYGGVLTKLSDLNENRAGLQKKVEEFKAYFQKEYASPVPDDALLIIDFENEGSAYENLNTGGEFMFVPIGGTALSVYLAVKLSDVLPSKIEGVLEPKPREKFADFQNALGAEIPARIGIVTQWSGEARNIQKQKEGTENVIIGLVLVGFAMLLTYIKKMRRKNKAAKST